ncbi:MAG TPA: response regulator [Polyangiaceae bacterium]
MDRVRLRLRLRQLLDRWHTWQRPTPAASPDSRHGRTQQRGALAELLRPTGALEGGSTRCGKLRADLLQQAFSTVPYRVFWKDVDCVYRGCNHNFLEEVGARSADDVVGKTDYDMPWSSIATQCRADDREVLDSGLPKLQYEVCVPGEQGAPQWLLMSKVPILDRGRSVGVLGSFDDITRRKAAEDERDALRLHLENIFASMPSALIGVDGKGAVVQWNGAAERWCAAGLTPARGQHFDAAFPRLARAIPALSRAMAAHEAWSAARVPLTLGGADVFCDVMLYPLGNRGQGAVLRLDDVTDLAVKDELLRQAQKMDSVGQLAGGLAHDFNNSLVGINGGLSLLKARLVRGDQDPAELLELVDLAQRGVDGASDLVQRLLTLSRKHVVNYATVDLRDLVRDVTKICSTTFSREIELGTDLGHEPIWVSCDHSQIEQALLNLCINAADAIAVAPARSGHHQLLVSVGRVRGDDERFARYFPQGKLRDYVALKVSDTGVGMDEALLRRIFEPFFTTKEPSKGTGLGLSMVASIVKQHQGAVDVISAPAQGTTFTLYFARDQNQHRVREVTQSFHGVQRKGRVLVVDDHEMVRTTLCHLLEDKGYTVLSAESGHDAVELFRKLASELTLVVLDMVMPQYSGKQAFLAMQAIHPEVPILLMSGCDTETEVEQTLALGARGFLKKPFTAHALTSAIDAALATSDAAHAHGVSA